MGVATGADLVLGLGALLVVPYHRRNQVAPSKGQAIYLAHALLGLALAAGALAMLGPARRSSRTLGIGAVTGLVGLAVAGLGGILSVVQATRLIGMGLMLLGSVAAEAGYLMPLLEEPAPTSSP